MALNDIYTLVHEGRMDTGQQLVTTLHFKQTTVEAGNSDPSALQLAQAYLAASLSAFAATMCGNATLQKIAVRNETNPTEAAEMIVSPEQSGSQAAEYSAPQNCTEVLWKDGLAGRRHMNRSYLWPMAEASVSNGVLSTTHIDAVLAWAATFLTLGDDATYNGYQHIVWSKTYNLDNPRNNVLAIPRVRNQTRRTLGFGS